jgi:hypothetical protein
MTEAEAASVLRQLLARHAELRWEALGLVRSQLATVERAGVAEAVRDAMLAVSLDDIWDRSGARRDGYVEEVEAAWEVFEEALAPFSDEVVRMLEVGETDAARATVEGALVALHDLPRDHGNDSALSRAEDFPGEAAGTLVDRWAAAGGGPLGDAFLQRFVPRWATFLARHRA